MAQTAGIINGADLLVYVGGTLIAHSTSCTLDISMATRDISTKSSAGWSEKGAGQRSWTVSGDGLYSFDAAYGFSNLMALITNRTSVTLKLSTTNDDNDRYHGTAYLTSISLSAPNEDNSTFSFSFEGSGSLVESVGS